MVLGALFAPTMFKLTDELLMVGLLTLTGLDILYNRAWRKYRMLFVLLGILLFYLLYSYAFSSYNTAWAKTSDFLIQMKPLVAFSVTYAIAPRFTATQKQILKWICILLSVFAFVIVLLFNMGLYREFYNSVLLHVYYEGVLCACCGLVYLMMSARKREDGKAVLSPYDLFWTLTIFLMGLASTRSKYYGFTVVVIYMLLFYRPGMLKLTSPKSIAVMIAVAAMVLLVSWEKISFYFITGGTGQFSLDTMEAFARFALYLGFFWVMQKHFFLGSGLASFATFSSGSEVNYSSIYHEFDLDKVWGLSPDMCSFVADTFYPEFAQFGIVGIAMIVYFCLWVWRKVKLLIRINGNQVNAQVAILVIVFLAIDATSSALVVQAGGSLTMALLAMALTAVKSVPKEQAKEILKKDINEIITNKTVISCQPATQTK